MGSDNKGEEIRIACDSLIGSTLRSFQSRHIKLPGIYPYVNFRK